MLRLSPEMLVYRQGQPPLAYVGLRWSSPQLSEKLDQSSHGPHGRRNAAFRLKAELQAVAGRIGIPYLSPAPAASNTPPCVAQHPSRLSRPRHLSISPVLCRATVGHSVERWSKKTVDRTPPSSPTGYTSQRSRMSEPRGRRNMVIAPGVDHHATSALHSMLLYRTLNPQSQKCPPTIHEKRQRNLGTADSQWPRNHQHAAPL